MNTTTIENTFAKLLKNIDDLGYAFMIEIRHYKREFVAMSLLNTLQQFRSDLRYPDNRLNLLLEEYKTLSNDIDKVLDYYKSIEKILNENTELYERFYDETFKE